MSMVIEQNNNRTSFEAIFGLGPIFLGVNLYCTKTLNFRIKTRLIGANPVKKCTFFGTNLLKMSMYYGLLSMRECEFIRIF
jgi:hypothetical protein